MTIADSQEIPPEDTPDGTFGHARPRLPDHIHPCTPAEQAAHYAALGDALCGFDVGAALRQARPAPTNTSRIDHQE